MSEEKNIIVSRPDISCTELTHYPKEDRLITLPIDKYIAKLTDINGEPITLNPVQYAMANYLQNPKYRFITVVVARRTGKTAMANWLANLLSLHPNNNIVIISPNYTLSQISMNIQLDLFKRFGIKPTRSNLKDRIIVLENNSTIRMASVNQVDSAVGISTRLLLADEAALHDNLGEAFSLQLRPTLDRVDSKAIFVTTPRGSNYIQEYYNRGFGDEYPTWGSIWANWKINPRAQISDIEDARKSVSKQYFNQEYLGSFLSVEGQIFEYDDDNIIDFEKDYRGKIDVQMVCAGTDTGWKDYTTMIVGYFTDDCIFIVDEYKKKELSTDKHAENFHYMVNVHDIDIIYIDGANAQFRQDLMLVYDLPTMLAKKDVLAGINYTQALLENKRILIDKGCTELLNSMLQYRWNPNENLVKPKPEHTGSDMCDALRYLVYNAAPGILAPLVE